MKFGSFVDIGLPKHILVPKNKQKGTFEIGKRRVLQLLLDDKTNRLIASEKYDLLKENEINKIREIVREEIKKANTSEGKAISLIENLDSIKTKNK